MIERRYLAGLKNFLHLYIPHCELWMLVDNSLENFELNEIASGELNEIKSVANYIIWNPILESYRDF